MLVQQLQSLLPMKSEYQQKLDKKFRLEFNYNSNHIEGNTLTYGETELLLIFGQTKGNHEIREYDEMKAHNVAFELVKDWASDKEHQLTETDIKNLNQIILVEPFWKDAITPDGQTVKRLIKIGNYKEYPNSVRLQNGEIFEYASPMETPIEMGDLIQWYRAEEEKKELHPVELAALLHYRFGRIHPFDDGNGRISRLLINYVLLKNDLPPVIIKSEDKKNYLSALHQADAGYIDEFVNYIAVQFIWSLEISIKAAKGESIDEPGDFEKRLGQLKKKHRVKEVRVEKSSDAILGSIDKAIQPLIAVISAKMGPFRSFFKNKNEIITYYTQLKNYELAGDKINTDVVKKYDLEGIEYTYAFYKTKLNVNNFSISINLIVLFYQLGYDIKFPKIDLNISKVFLEEISTEECESIADKIGNYVLEEIEKATGN